MPYLLEKGVFIMAASGAVAALREMVKLAAFKVVYPLTYKLFCLRPQRQLALFCEVRSGTLTDTYKPICAELKRRGFPFKVFFIHNNKGGLSYLFRYLKLCTLLPQASAIIINDTCNLFGAFKLRKGTRLVQTWHSCGAFKKWGYSLKGMSFGQQADLLDRYPSHTNYTLVTVSSEECIPHFNEAFGFTAPSCVKATGVARTDRFFNEKNKAAAFGKIYEICPAAKNADKIILYAPTYRGDADNAQPPEQFSLTDMKKALPKGCILLIKQHGFVKKKTVIPPDCADIVFDVSQKADIESLLFVSDVCITDYSSLIFEYSLFERPMIFYAYDLDEFNSYRGSYYEYNDDFLPGQTARTPEQLFAALTDALNGNYDIDRIRRFRDRFMSACDGHSAQRIADYITGRDDPA